MSELQNAHEKAEQHIRRKMYDNSVLYYRMNLTTSVLEEYRNVQGKQHEVFTTPYQMEGKTNYLILNNVEEKYRNNVEDRLFPEGLMRRYRKGEMTVTYEYRRELVNKGFHWVRGTAIIVVQPETQNIIAFVYIQDIDDEKKTAMAIKSVLDEEIESVIRVNLRNRTVSIAMENRTWNGRRQGDAFPLEDNFVEAMVANIVEEDCEECRKFIHLENILDGLKKQNIMWITYRLKVEDGRILRKKVRAMYLDEYQEDIIYARRDITDLYEEEQRQKRRLENAIDEANAANQAKSEFLSNISHDMRTPLNAILSLSGEELLENTTEAQKLDYLQKIHSSGQYLLGIINNVLDMSKIENQKMLLVPEHYTIQEFENTMQTIIGEQCRQKNISFIMDVHSVEYVSVILDKVRFNQIFVNLLSNAVKYTPAGGKIELIVEHIETIGNYAKKRFIVRDNGIGMSPEFLPHAFDSFSQEIHNNRSVDAQGTGLGLAIVKKIVELMHGTIQLESTPGRGTTYTILMELPIAEEAIHKEEMPKDDTLLQGRHILLCEDHPLNTQIAKMLLEKKNCIVDTAENGQIGLQRFENSEEGFYDIVLMDIRMPVMDGLEATAKIRSLTRRDAKKVPIIAMTANAFTEDTMISMKAGMSDHLTKPIDPKVFYETLLKYISQK